MASAGMIKGQARTFAYAGRVAGGVGLLEQDGKRTDGRRGHGLITLSLR
jgi:hypothetical protein